MACIRLYMVTSKLSNKITFYANKYIHKLFLHQLANENVKLQQHQIIGQHLLLHYFMIILVWPTWQFNCVCIRGHFAILVGT